MSPVQSGVLLCKLRAIRRLPAPLRAELRNWQQRHTLAILPPEVMLRLHEVSGLSPQQLTLTLLPVAAHSLTRVSQKFHVGAIAGGVRSLLSPVPTWSLPQSLNQTIRAEQCAINHAWLRNETGLLMTINASPCGHCRQFMNETTTAQTLRIYL